MCQIAPYFWFVCKANPPVHISGYVLADATQQTDQRTSHMVFLFFAEALTHPNCKMAWAKDLIY